MNKVIIIGRVVKDFDLKYTQSNMATCSFTLAVDKGLSREKREEAEASNRPTADFPRVVVWGRMAENASSYLSKGSRCAVEGRIQTGSYQDKETGKAVYTTDIVADNIEYLDGANRTQNNAGATERNNRGNYTSNGGNYHRGQNKDDFFDDDFQEVQDDGRIPF